MVTAYLRVSTDRQSVDNQRSEISHFAQKQGLVVEKWVKETVSGTVSDADRKLGGLLKRLGKGDILIVSEMSRLSRSLMEIMSIMKSLLQKGVTIYSIKENCRLSDDLNSKVLIFAFGLTAEIERDLISMRTREALAARRERGMSLGRRKGSHPKIDCLLSLKSEVTWDIDSGMPIGEVCAKYGVSRSTLRKFRMGEPE